MTQRLNEIVQTRCGPVRGEPVADGQTLAFRGVPFAAPPLGDLRWRPPQPVTPWTSIRDCRQFGPIPIQQQSPLGSLFPSITETQSEDCLFLNVWTRSTNSGERQPVIVWFYPGAFQFGSGSAPMYQGENWAQAGAVFVSLNFRVSRLGFLAHPELSEEDADGVSGNYGLLDQIRALEWVRDNIAGFGGDPDCVTIFGVSSGASSVSLLMTSPVARGLFHRAIAESGASFGPIAETTGVGDQWQTLGAAMHSGQAWAESIGSPRLADLRSLDPSRIREASVGHRSDRRGVFDASRPVIDGKTLTDGSYSLFLERRQAQVPLLVGSAANEGLAMITFASDCATYLSQSRDEHGSNLAEFLSLYPASDDREAIASGLKANGHRLFTWQNWTWARLHAAAGNDVYYYRFEQSPPVPENRYVQQELPRALGAFHGASIFYSFNRFHLRPDWPWSEHDRLLSTTLVEAWIHFARSGRPKSNGLPEWPVFEPNNPVLMSLGESLEMRGVPDLIYLRFWDKYYAMRQPTASIP
jgi:para-nitrobenzyl esterase